MRCVQVGNHEREPRRLCRAAIVVFGLACLAGVLRASDAVSDDPWRWIAVRHEKSERITWYEPERDYVMTYDFKVYPAIIRRDDGQRWLVLLAVRKSETGVGVKSIEVRVDGASSMIPVNPRDLDIDRSGCRVAERITLWRQQALIRSIAVAKEVEVVVRGVHSAETYRLEDEEREDFRHVLALYDMPAMPNPDAGTGTGCARAEFAQVTKAEPVFPKQAFKKKIMGKVTLQAVIRKDGTVGGIKVIRSTACDCGFEAQAISALREGKYKPVIKKGQPMESCLTVKIDFRDWTPFPPYSEE